MNLSEAYGSKYGRKDKPVIVIPLGAAEAQSSSQSSSQSPSQYPQIESSVTKPRRNPDVDHNPDLYVINITINRDDCHLICMFFFVFIMSFLLSNRRTS